MKTPWFSRLWKRSRTSLKGIRPDDFAALLRPKCKQIITEEELTNLLSGGKKLKVKLGVDPTGFELHLGHAVPLMLLRLFARAGHSVQFVIGDFTGQIGDPSGQGSARVELTPAQIKKNMNTYGKQIAPLIDIRRMQFYKNSHWLARMKLADFFKVIGAISLSDVMQREDFRNRIKAGTSVTLREANYASLMAVDSLHLKTDIEIGGIDQLLNMMQARAVMAAAGEKPEVILSTPLIEGTAGDGRKMSKSYNNYIALRDAPERQFGLIMSIPDALITSYFVSFGDIYNHEVEALERYIAASPLDAKKQLGMLIVSFIHGERAAERAQKEFERRFSKKEYTSHDETVVATALPANIVDALRDASGGEWSKTRIRALIVQGGVRKLKHGGDAVINTMTETVREGDLVRVGKMHLFRFIIK